MSKTSQMSKRSQTGQMSRMRLRCEMVKTSKISKMSKLRLS